MDAKTSLNLYGYLTASKSTTEMMLTNARGALEAAEDLQREAEEAGLDYQRLFLWADSLAYNMRNTINVYETLLDTDPAMLPTPAGEPPK